MDLDAVQRSFDRLATAGDELADSFYQHLFAHHPEVVPLFERVDLVSQRKKLIATLTLVVSHLDRVEVVHPVLKELGRRHVRYGVGPALYDAFISSFLAILAEHLSQEWTPRLEQSWTSALRRIANVMIDSASGHARLAPDAPPSDELAVLMQISGNPEVARANARLFTAFLAKKLHDHDLEIARDVQRTLLPATLQAPEGYGIEALYEPAREVGGDYYDCIALGDGRVCVTFGDVAGKGVAAALVMSRLASAVEATVKLLPDPGAAMASLNDHMCRRVHGGRFVTLLILMLDPVRHRIQIANAGHRAPFLRRGDGRVEAVAPEIAGLPVGILPGEHYEVAERSLASEDVVLLFTDGIDEARSPDGAFYGVERLERWVAGASGEPRALARGILDEIRSFSAGRPATDDIAILTISRAS